LLRKRPARVILPTADEAEALAELAKYDDMLWVQEQHKKKGTRRTTMADEDLASE
jgi:hypothetical protein